MSSAVLAIDYRFKIALCGEAGVGKTSLAQVVSGQRFSAETKSTVGVDFITLQMDVDGALCVVLLWDTAGQERFAQTADFAYRGTHAIIGVYDITKRATYDALWTRMHDANAVDETLSKRLVVFGNKADLADKRAVTTDEAREASVARDYSFMEVSATREDDTRQAMREIVQSLVLTKRKYESKLAARKAASEYKLPSTVKLEQNMRENVEREAGWCLGC